MSARYEKVIVILEDDGQKVKCVVISDDRTHTPIFYGVDKYGMDDILELFGGRAPIDGADTKPLSLQNPPGRTK